METITVLRMDKAEFSELLREAIREELHQILKELNSKEIEDIILNRKETCKLLDISQGTMQKFQNEGRIPFYRIGRRILFNKSEVLKALEAKTLSSRKFQLNIKVKGRFL
jgi:excisionase family DNA binding protein